jgi:hypothetical protein
MSSNPVIYTAKLEAVGDVFRLEAPGCQELSTGGGAEKSRRDSEKRVSAQPNSGRSRYPVNTSKARRLSLSIPASLLMEAP